MIEIRDTTGAEAILPFCYGGSNGLLTQDTNDAALFRGFKTSRLARTVCAAPTGAASQALYGKMPGVTYARLRARPADRALGRESFGVGHPPGAVSQGGPEGRGAPRRRRSPRHGAGAHGGSAHCAEAGHRSAACAGASPIPVRRRLRGRGVPRGAHARGATRFGARASEWTIERAAEVAGIDASRADPIRGDVPRLQSPALVRCGWGLERNRNGGSAAAAILALPAVGGKFGVRGGGFSMSNSAALGIKAAAWMNDTPEPSTRLVNMNHLGRALLEYTDPPVEMLFVYNCNPLATMPEQNRVLEGLKRDDLFTVVYEQVFTDTTRYADVVLPATTFLENYDIAKGYGPISLQLVRPVIEPCGEARSNAEVFSDLAGRLGLGEPEEEIDTLLRVTSRLPPQLASELMETGAATPPFDGAPMQFVDVFPRTPDQKIDLFPAALDSEAPLGLYGYQPDPGTETYPLALISPASEKTVSSTLGELRKRAAVLQMNPADAVARGLATDDPVRVFNELGEVHCAVALNADIRPGTVSLAKGLWRKSTYNGSTSNALVPDTLTDLGAGACFNDARVQVASLGSTEHVIRGSGSGIRDSEFGSEFAFGFGVEAVGELRAGLRTTAGTRNPAPGTRTRNPAPGTPNRSQ